MLAPHSAAARRLAQTLDGQAPAPHDEKTLRAVLATAALRPAPLISEESARRVHDNSRAELHRLRAARRTASATAGSRDGLDDLAGNTVVIQAPGGRTVRASSSIDEIDQDDVLRDVEQAMRDTERSRGPM
ncbi:hypothetical protein AB0O47_32460 [Streptomyces noursei]|uniref:hypothetical protein n=1 Tax=Streptomyces noursei TaxID=1971 RepID=UPI00344F476E